VEDQKQGQDKAAKEGVASSTAKEADQVRVKVLGELLAEPVTQSRTRDVVFLGVLPLRRVAGVLEVVNGTGNFRAVPAESICAEIEGGYGGGQWCR
jgi:hypothetical protein